MAPSTRFARETPVKASFHAPFMLSSVAGLFAVQVWRYSSSQRPLSYQSWPRVGTMISFGVISLSS
jgi:hypothetical protein